MIDIFHGVDIYSISTSLSNAMSIIIYGLVTSLLLTTLTLGTLVIYAVDIKGTVADDNIMGTATDDERI